jgi:hypothetical protein
MEKKKKRGFWRWLIASVMLRLILIYLPKTFNLASRPEVSTPLVSLRRRKYSLSLSLLLSHSSTSQPNFIFTECFFAVNLVAEGYWLKQSSISPYAGNYCSCMCDFFFYIYLANNVQEMIYYYYFYIFIFIYRIDVPWISIVTLTSWSTHC